MSFKNADDKLSRAASVLWRRSNMADEMLEDLHAFHAPSECRTLVFQDWDLDTDREIAATGINPDELHDLIEERTTPLTAYLLTIGLS